MTNSSELDLEEGNLVVIAVYHPPNNNLAYADTFCKTIGRVVLDYILTVLYG